MKKLHCTCIFPTLFKDIRSSCDTLIENSVCLPTMSRRAIPHTFDRDFIALWHRLVSTENKRINYLSLCCGLVFFQSIVDLFGYSRLKSFNKSFKQCRSSTQRNVRIKFTACINRAQLNAFIDKGIDGIPVFLVDYFRPEEHFRGEESFGTNRYFIGLVFDGENAFDVLVIFLS